MCHPQLAAHALSESISRWKWYANHMKREAAETFLRDPPRNLALPRWDLLKNPGDKLRLSHCRNSRWICITVEADKTETSELKLVEGRISWVKESFERHLERWIVEVSRPLEKLQVSLICSSSENGRERGEALTDGCSRVSINLRLAPVKCEAPRFTIYACMDAIRAMHMHSRVRFEAHLAENLR
jgi:hypothetical protein